MKSSGPILCIVGRDGRMCRSAVERALIATFTSSDANRSTHRTTHQRCCRQDPRPRGYSGRSVAQVRDIRCGREDMLPCRMRVAYVDTAVLSQTLISRLHCDARLDPRCPASLASMPSSAIQRATYQHVMVNRCVYPLAFRDGPRRS